MYDPKGFSIWEGLFYVVGAAFAGSLGAVMLKQIEGVVAGSASPSSAS
jgi:O-acetylserine/cysteine efflux transporter